MVRKKTKETELRIPHLVTFHCIIGFVRQITRARCQPPASGDSDFVPSTVVRRIELVREGNAYYEVLYTWDTHARLGHGVVTR
jgi:hypothetical protein